MIIGGNIKHSTGEGDQEGNDHKVSLLPFEFCETVNPIRYVEGVVWTDDLRTIIRAIKSTESLAKSVINLSLEIKKGLCKAVQGRESMCDIVLKSLSRFYAKGVSILPQTLPSFSWHLRRKLYCNLFVNSVKILMDTCNS